MLYEKKVQKEFSKKPKMVFNPSCVLDDATTCKQEVSQKKTPNKTSGILQLLTSLNGLTPEGMAHLIETQERLKIFGQTSHSLLKENLSIDVDDLKV